MIEEINDYFIDLFCGAGGTTTGIIRHGIVIACINHDKNAIASHSANHPNAVHFTEDIRTVALGPLIEMVNEIRRKNPKARIHLWASLECTNHSNAKGGMSRDADSRTLANHLDRYIEALNPDMIWIENVREFQDWCRLRLKGKTYKKYSKLIMSKPTKEKPYEDYIYVPDKRYKGEHYEAWKANMESYGYNSEKVILNAADYGCDTSRVRLFMQFAKPNITISWPAATHDQKERNGLLPWRPVRPLLDLEDCGDSIFDRNKAYAEASLWRIFRGLNKFVKEPFLIKYYGKGDNSQDLSNPCPTLTTKDRVYFVRSEYGKSTGRSLNEPCPTIATNPKESLVTVNFLYDHQFSNTGSSIDKPCPTLIARQDKKPMYLLTADGHPQEMEWIFKKVKKTYRRSKAMAAIIQFMLDHNISNISVRPLRIVEMLKIMGFPATYVLIGTETEKKKYIGNAVPCYMVEQLVGHSIKENNLNRIAA